MLPHLWSWLWTWYLYDKWNQTEKITSKIFHFLMFFSPTHLSWECTIAHWWSSDLSWYQDSFCVSNLGSCLTIISVIICESVWFMMIGGHRVRVTTYTSSTSRIFVLEDPSTRDYWIKDLDDFLVLFLEYGSLYFIMPNYNFCLVPVHKSLSEVIYAQNLWSPNW